MQFFKVSRNITALIAFYLITGVSFYGHAQFYDSRPDARQDARVDARQDARVDARGPFCQQALTKPTTATFRVGDSLSVKVETAKINGVQTVVLYRNDVSFSFIPTEAAVKVYVRKSFIESLFTNGQWKVLEEMITGMLQSYPGLDPLEVILVNNGRLLESPDEIFLKANALELLNQNIIEIEEL